MMGRMSIVAVFAFASFAHGAGEELRTFAVTVDKKPSGTHLISIQSGADGTQTITTQADVTVKILFITYKYVFRGIESWKEGRLYQLSTTTDDNGKKHSVTATANNQGLALTADGKPVQLKGDHWVTTFWQLPPAKQRGANVLLLDADTGKTYTAKLEKIGIEKLALLGQTVEGVHYKVTGDRQFDLWFDGDDRLIRQESIEEGHRTVLELTRLQRD